MNRSKDFKHKFEQLIRSLDQFGHPIAFTYKNSSSFKTTFGGVVTLCEFDIGFSVEFLIPPEQEIKSIDQYVEVSFSTFKNIYSNGSFSEELIELPVSKCQAGRFNGEQSQTETFGITNKYTCPINFKTALQGSYTTQYAQMLQVQVRKCNQTNLTIKNKTLTCASAEEIDRILNHLTINILMTNQFIDVNEKYGNPIKTVLKQFFATAQSKLSLYYQLKLGQNFLIQSTSSLSNLLGQQNLTYYTITHDSMQIADSNLLGSYITCQILLDDIVTTTNMELYTLSDALSNVGGIIGIISIVVQVLVSKIQEQLYYQSLIKQQFQITSDLIVKQHINVKIGKTNLNDLEQPSMTGLKNHQKATKLDNLIRDLKN
ncbi:UNKNOWN [Stylonychia lemnae]|uniref:Uncharacterized protein n=1 Tax=Stylonychia lemnae TaxID=5949 RepID=A0A077ZXI7_STYLE|nr:UNKNOWN [Stylonychia lemnae]|eukprot:CDW73261.1 UNKNOWN [Stylonychia lemnae]